MSEKLNPFIALRQPGSQRVVRKPSGWLLLAALLAICSGWSQTASLSRRPFGDSFSQEHRERARSYDLQHVLLQLRLDERRKTVSGTGTLVLRPLNQELHAIEVDSAELQIHSVTLQDGTALPFQQSGETLRISLPAAAGPDDSVSLRIAYEATPRKGLYFIGPDAAYPRRPVQIWSQDEMEDAHFWFPVYDYPNDKATSEGYYTVNEEFTVISNGRLLGVAEDRASRTKTFHWKQEVPHSTYLISVVAGKFEKYTDEVDGIPLEYYVPPGTGRAKALRTFGETPLALRFFTERFGLPYPFSKYSQVAVHDFIFGGMENTSATTLTDRTLHEAVSEPQASSTDLVAHELSHQWFGDWVTASAWAHIWLHEGFATFWAAAFREHRFGKEEYRHSLHKARDSYLEEDRDRYRRPLVTSVYADPNDLFDRTVYQKGALVLDMLRFVLGDERFFAAMNHFASTHREGSVTTDDFRASAEQAAGEDLGWFFDQWIYQAGYPELQVTQDWNEAERRLRLVIEQKQLLDALTPLFRMPVDVEFTTQAGKKTVRIEFSKAREEYAFSLDSQPRMIRFDPEDRILKTLEFLKSVPDLLYQLEHDPSAPGRIWASVQLGQIRNQPEVVRALRARLTADPFWAARESAAAALGRLRTEDAREALATGLQDKDPRVRQASVRGLSTFWKDPKAAKLAETVYSTDPNPVTAAEAANTIGKIKAKGALQFLRRAVERESDQDVIRRYALAGLGDLGDPAGWDIAARWLSYGRPPQTRVVAVETLSKLGRGKEKTADKLIALLDDPDLFVRQRAIFALGEGNFGKARPALEKSALHDVQSSTRRAAQKALQWLTPASTGSFVPGANQPAALRSAGAGGQTATPAFAGAAP